VIAALKAMIGQLRLALGVQNAQLPILGSFQKGTLTVPQQGLYELHGGETVVPAGRHRGGDGFSIGRCRSPSTSTATALRRRRCG
jgi:hypothetical protein